MDMALGRRHLLGMQFVLAVVLGSGCTNAGSHTAPSPSPQPDTTAGAESASGADPIVCRKEDVPGHRMPKRVCRHQSEIDAQRDAAQKVMQQTQTAPSPAQQPGMNNNRQPM
jgi:hypothetical protein